MEEIVDSSVIVLRKPYRELICRFAISVYVAMRKISSTFEVLVNSERLTFSWQ